MIDVAQPLRAQAQASHRLDSDTYVAHSLKADGFDASEDGTGRGTPIVPHTVGALTDGAHMGGGLTARTPTQDELSRCLNAGGMGRQDWETETLVVEPTVQAVREKKQNGIGIGGEGDPMFTMTGRDQHAIAFAQNQREEVRTMDVAGALASEPGMKQQTYLHQAMSVRRLTPRECDRLQGFPDDYELVPYRGKPAADGPRYKALGNSMAVPVMRWIGERIAAVENLSHD